MCIGIRDENMSLDQFNPIIINVILKEVMNYAVAGNLSEKYSNSPNVFIN